MLIRNTVAVDSVRAIVWTIVLVGQTCSVAGAAEFIANRAVACQRLLVGLCARKLLRTFLVIALLDLQAILAVGGRYT